MDFTIFLARPRDDKGRMGFTALLVIAFANWWPGTVPLARPHRLLCGDPILVTDRLIAPSLP